MHALTSLLKFLFSHMVSEYDWKLHAHFAVNLTDLKSNSLEQMRVFGDNSRIILLISP